MLGSTCPIHSVTHFGVTHYAMHPALNTNTNCTCNFMAKGTKGTKPPKPPKPPKPAKRAKRSARTTPMEELAHELFLGLLQYGEHESHTALSLVSVAFGERMAALKRTAKFGPKQLVLAHGSCPILAALDRVEAASIRFPALEDVSVNLWNALSDCKGFTDARRAPILAKLCTFTFVTKLVLSANDIAVLPDAVGALTNLKYLTLRREQDRDASGLNRGSRRAGGTAPRLQQTRDSPGRDRLAHGADDSRPRLQLHRDAPHHDRSTDRLIFARA